jgi:hypothetical protein
MREAAGDVPAEDDLDRQHGIAWLGRVQPRGRFDRSINVAIGVLAFAPAAHTSTLWRAIRFN